MIHQYAYIPIERINDLKLSYSIADPSTWIIIKDGFQFGGLEEIEFSVEQKNEIIELNGQWFNDKSNFDNWLNQNNVLTP